MAEQSPAKAKVITILNLKGGVGKTHATWLLASVCHERQLRALLIDTDAQGNLSNSFLRATPHEPGVEQLLDPSVDAEIHDLIRRTEYPTIDVIPASGAVTAFDESGQKRWERADLHRSLVDPVRAVESIYDFIIFDCPPRLSLVSFAALCASNHLIVPLEAADWGAQGIVQVTDAMEYVRERFNPGLSLMGYLVSRFRPARSYQQTYLQELRNHFGPRVFDTVIVDLAGFERSVTDAIPITQHERHSRASAIARQFFDEVCRRTAERQPRRSGGVPANRRAQAKAAAR